MLFSNRHQHYFVHPNLMSTTCGEYLLRDGPSSLGGYFLNEMKVQSTTAAAEKSFTLSLVTLNLKSVQGRNSGTLSAWKLQNKCCAKPFFIRRKESRLKRLPFLVFPHIARYLSDNQSLNFMCHTHFLVPTIMDWHLQSRSPVYQFRLTIMVPRQ